MLLLRCSLYPRIFAVFYTYHTYIYKIQYGGYIDTYTHGLAHIANERNLYCRRIFKSNEKKNQMYDERERARKRGRKSTNKTVHSVCFDRRRRFISHICLSALCVLSSLITAASSKSLSFIRSPSLAPFAYLSEQLVCACVCMLCVLSVSVCTIVIRLFINVLLLIFQLKRISRTHKTVYVYIYRRYKANEMNDRAAQHIWMGNHTRKPMMMCTTRFGDSNFVSDYDFVFLFCFFASSSRALSLALLFFIACSFSSIHSNSHERTQMVISLIE